MEYVVTEGVAGYWHYHLSEKVERPIISLCGKPVMLTHLPFSAWGTKGHLGERWCEECAKKAGLKETK
jgi:hypothetical protein